MSEENQNGVDRFSVSLPVQLLKELDAMIRASALMFSC